MLDPAPDLWWNQFNSEESEVSVSKEKPGVFQQATAADRVDYPALEATIQKWWDDKGVLRMYL